MRFKIKILLKVIKNTVLSHSFITLTVILCTVVTTALILNGSIFIKHTTTARKYEIPITKFKTNKTSTHVSYIKGYPCQLSQVKIALAQNFSGDLSYSTGAILSITNISEVACSLEGYPTITIGNFVSKPIPLTINETEIGLVNVQPRLVSLSPNQNAYFGISTYDNDGTGLRQGCITGDIAIMLPGSNASLKTNINYGVCPPGLYVTGIAYIGAFSNGCPDGENNFPGPPLLPQCPQPPSPKPVTLLNITGQAQSSCASSNSSTCTVVYSRIPTYTPTVHLYYINVSYEPLSMTNNLVTLTGMPVNNSTNNTAGYFNNSYNGDGGNHFSLLEFTSGGQPLNTIQLSITGAKSWNISVTESSKPLYAIINQ